MSLPVIFFGTPEFSVPALQGLCESGSFRVSAVVTQPDRPAGRGRKVSISPVKAVALEHGIPVLQPQSIRKEGETFIKQAMQFGPFEAGVVVAFGQILPAGALALPRRGCVNIHASLLPRWRGAAPIQRALISGDEKTGVCLMAMDAGLDTGAVYTRAETPIAPADTFEILHDRLAGLGARLLTEHLPAIVSGDLKAEPQSPEGVTYAAKILPEEGQIDWRKSASEIHRLIHGLSPYPGAFTFSSGQRLKVLRACELPLAESKAAPGTITAVTAERLEVQCGRSALLIEEVQLEGRKRMPAGDFLRGYPLSPGM